MFTGSIVMDHLCFLFLGVSLKHTDGPSRGFFHSSQFPVGLCFAFNCKTRTRPITSVCQHLRD